MKSFWHKLGVYFGFAEPPEDPDAERRLAADTTRQIVRRCLVQGILEGVLFGVIWGVLHGFANVGAAVGAGVFFGVAMTAFPLFSALSRRDDAIRRYGEQAPMIDR